VNEIYGQTEANYVVGNCSEVWPVRAGSMGRPYPGHTVAVLNEDGAQAAVGDVGEIAVSSGDPVAFLRYWEQPGATAAKYTADGGWLCTGDLASVDDDGYLWFTSRSDDVINSAGYRIGPAEIEECLMQHRAVAMAAAVGVPDPIRGEVVKAFIQLAQGNEPSPELVDDIQQLVRRRLAAYEYPREVEFVDELPLTTTGKIRRADLRERARARPGSVSPQGPARR
jgi:acetyl-CoA synthetase